MHARRGEPERNPIRAFPAFPEKGRLPVRVGSRSRGANFPLSPRPDRTEVIQMYLRNDGAGESVRRFLPGKTAINLVPSRFRFSPSVSGNNSCVRKAIHYLRFLWLCLYLKRTWQLTIVPGLLICGYVIICNAFLIFPRSAAPSPGRNSAVPRMRANKRVCLNESTVDLLTAGIFTFRTEG